MEAVDGEWGVGWVKKMRRLTLTSHFAVLRLSERASDTFAARARVEDGH